MSTRQLPEELIRDILGYVFHRVRVSFDDWGFDMEQDWTTVQDFFALQPPERPGVNASMLRVCKQWHRVGMPLLYESVVIVDTAQLKTLADTLVKRPEIGPVIKKLRLKRAFGKDLVTVLSLTPNIHTLSVSVHVPSRASVAGLRRALLKLRIAATPTRLLVTPPQYLLHHRPNANTSHIVTSLIVMISTWPDLKRIDIGGDDTPSWFYRLLEEAKGLEYLGVSMEVAEHMLRYSTNKGEQLVRQPAFKNILCRAPQRVVDKMKEDYPGPIADAILCEQNNPDVYIL